MGGDCFQSKSTLPCTIYPPYTPLDSPSLPVVVKPHCQVAEPLNIIGGPLLPAQFDQRTSRYTRQNRFGVERPVQVITDADVDGLHVIITMSRDRRVLQN